MGKALEMDRVAPVLDFIKQDINQGNGATGWVDRAKVAGFSDEDISEAVEWLGRARQYLDGAMTTASGGTSDHKMSKLKV